MLLPSDVTTLCELAEMIVDRPPRLANRIREFARGVGLAWLHLVENMVVHYGDRRTRRPSTLPT